MQLIWCPRVEPGRSGTGVTYAKWLIWENDELGAGERLLIQAIFVLGDIFIFIGSEMRNLGSPFTWKAAGAGW